MSHGAGLHLLLLLLDGLRRGYSSAVLCVDSRFRPEPSSLQARRDKLTSCFNVTAIVVGNNLQDVHHSPC